MVSYQFRPLGDWVGPQTKGRQWPRFKAAYGDTIDLLIGEIDKLAGRQVVIQVDLRESDIRLDGLPRSNARTGSHPGVVVSFESKFGPLQYKTDEFTEWKANLRAIALSLKALRDVDRYGVSKRGEQYRGWTALPPGVADRFESGLIAIPLRDREGRIVAEAVVDVEDWQVAEKPWYRLASGYVVRTEQRGARKVMLYLHRELLGLGPMSEDRIVVDHIDGNRLNCRRTNLRSVSHAENCQNRGANHGRHWARGVSFRREIGKWRAVGKLDGKAHEIGGSFETPEEAAEAIAAWRAEYMPFSEDARQAASDMVTFPSADEALRWMQAQAGVNGDAAPNALYRKLAARWHPDASTADPAEWERLSAARLLLQSAKMM